MMRWLVLIAVLLMGAPAAAHLPPGSGRIEVAEAGGAAREKMPVWLHRPAGWDEDGRVVVVVHGLNRDAGRYRDEWAALADAMRRSAAAQGAPFNWRVATVPGVGHSNAGMAAHAASQLFGR
jgi:poly(3-hydroxybutyrate) depolymerase